MDRDLVEQARRGDREAFGVLARTHADLLFAIAQRILREYDRSEDAVQQALVIAWQELPRLRDPGRFEPWLHRILVRCCYGEARRRRDWAAHVRILPAEGPSGPDGLGSVADRDELDRGFRRLPPEQRAILVLYHYLGQTAGEIADTLGVPAGTVRSRLHYAHRAMRASLDADARSASVAGRQSS